MSLDDDTIRIGHGPTAPRVLLVPTPPPAPRGPAVWLVVTAAVLLVAIAVATTAYLLGRADEATQAAEPTPTIVALDEAATCATLIPLLADAAAQIQAIADRPDGSTVTQTTVTGTLVGLRAIHPGAPANMRADIQAQIDTLAELEAVMAGRNTVLVLEDFRASGIRLASACRNYAN